MRLLAILIALALLAGCDDYPKERVRVENRAACTKEDKKDVAYFTLKCIENANPKSDEEPEDWIAICGKMATQVHCEYVPHKITYVIECSGCSWVEKSVEVINQIDRNE